MDVTLSIILRMLRVHWSEKQPGLWMVWELSQKSEHDRALQGKSLEKLVKATY